MTMMNRNYDYVFAVRPKSGAQIEAEAKEILDAFSPHLLNHPGAFDVLKFFDHTLQDVYGLKTGVALMTDGVEGQAWPDGRVFVSETTYDGACDKKGRARFTISHECFHGLKHLDQIRSVLTHGESAVLYRRTLIPPYRDPEWHADRFAASLLMPASMVSVVARKKPPGQIEQAIVDTFQVSAAAAKIRVKQVLSARTH